MRADTRLLDKAGVLAGITFVGGDQEFAGIHLERRDCVRLNHAEYRPLPVVDQIVAVTGIQPIEPQPDDAELNRIGRRVHNKRAGGRIDGDVRHPKVVFVDDRDRVGVNQCQAFHRLDLIVSGGVQVNVQHLAKRGNAVGRQFSKSQLVYHLARAANRCGEGRNVCRPREVHAISLFLPV